MKKGSIFFHKKFEFKNGDVGEKLLVLLNTPKSPSEPYLFCKTTSQQKDKPRKSGCNPDLSLFLILGKQDFFNKDTWLQLYDIYPFDVESALRDFKTKQMIIKGNLKNSTLGSLMDCIRRVQDIEEAYKKYILGSDNLLSTLSEVGGFRIKYKK